MIVTIVIAVLSFVCFILFMRALPDVGAQDEDF